MSHIKAEENDFEDGGAGGNVLNSAEDQLEYQELQRSIMSRSRSRQKRKGGNIQASETEPVKKYEETVKGELADIRTGLSQDTNIENMIASVTNKYL